MEGEPSDVDGVDISPPAAGEVDRPCGALGDANGDVGEVLGNALGCAFARALGEAPGRLLGDDCCPRAISASCGRPSAFCGSGLTRLASGSGVRAALPVCSFLSFAINAPRRRLTRPRDGAFWAALAGTLGAALVCAGGIICIVGFVWLVGAGCAFAIPAAGKLEGEGRLDPLRPGAGMLLGAALAMPGGFVGLIGINCGPPVDGIVPGEPNGLVICGCIVIMGMLCGAEEVFGGSTLTICGNGAGGGPTTIGVVDGGETIVGSLVVKGELGVAGDGFGSFNPGRPAGGKLAEGKLSGGAPAKGPTGGAPGSCESAGDLLAEAALAAGFSVTASSFAVGGAQGLEVHVMPPLTLLYGEAFGVFSQEQISQPGGATGSGLMRTSTGSLSLRMVG